MVILKMHLDLWTLYLSAGSNSLDCIVTAASTWVSHGTALCMLISLSAPCILKYVGCYRAESAVYHAYIYGILDPLILMHRCWARLQRIVDEDFTCTIQGEWLF